MFDESRLCISAGLKDPAVGQTDLFCVFPTVTTPEIFVRSSCNGENIARSVVNILSVTIKVIEYIIIGKQGVQSCKPCSYESAAFGIYRKKAQEERIQKDVDYKDQCRCKNLNLRSTT